MPYIVVRELPGWITFSLDGKYASPSTGGIIEVATRKVLTGLADENDMAVHTEKMVGFHVRNQAPIRTGN